MNYLSIQIRILFIIILLVGCSEEDPPNVNDPIPTTMPQEHIPWPSLADSPWPMYRHDPQGTGRSQYVGPQLGEIKWTLPFSDGIVASEGITSFAIGPDSTLYFGSSFERPEGLSQTWVFYATNHDGTVKWTYYDSTSSEVITTGPLVTADTTIIFGSNIRGTTLGCLYALSPLGSLRWRYIADEPFETHGINIGIDGTLYVTGTEGSLYAITPDGQLKWQLRADTEFRASGHSGVALSPDGLTIYVGGWRGYSTLFAIDTDGNVKWSFSTGTFEVGMGATPMVDNQGNIYISPVGTPADTNATGFFSVTPQGNLRWKYGTSGTSDEHYTIDKNGILYYGAHTHGHTTSQLQAIDYSGHALWNLDMAPTFFGPFTSDINGTIYINTFDILAVSGDEMLIIWQLPLPYIVWQSPAIGADGTLYLGFSCGEGNKYVYAIN